MKQIKLNYKMNKLLQNVRKLQCRALEDCLIRADFADKKTVLAPTVEDTFFPRMKQNNSISIKQFRYLLRNTTKVNNN